MSKKKHDIEDDFDVAEVEVEDIVSDVWANDGKKTSQFNIKVDSEYWKAVDDFCHEQRISRVAIFQLGMKEMLKKTGR